MAETQIVPLMSIQERYDTNVLFVNPALVEGVQPEDFVTTITPQLAVRSRGGLIDVNGSLGAVGEVYKNNPSLNYIGFNTGVSLGLTPVVSRLLPQATMTVSGSFQYTPQPPGFISPQQTSVENPFVRGIQAYRTNTINYMLGQSSTYKFTPNVSLVESFTYTKIQFGQKQVDVQASLLDTTSYVLTLGPAFRISRNDEVYNTFALNAYEQPGVGAFKTYDGTLGWRRSWSDSLATQAAGGAQLIQSTFLATGTSTSVEQPLSLVPTGTLSVTYASHTKVLGGFAETAGDLAGLPPGSLMAGDGGTINQYNLRLYYSFGAYPLFVAEGGLARSHVFGLTGRVSLTSNLSLTAGGNFGRNESTVEVQGFSYETVAANVGLDYLFTSGLRASVAYSYTNSYAIGNQDSGSIASVLTYTRQIVSLNLTYAFSAGNQLFQGGNFWGASGGGGTGSSVGGR